MTKRPNDHTHTHTDTHTHTRVQGCPLYPPVKWCGFVSVIECKVEPSLLRLLFPSSAFPLVENDFGIRGMKCNIMPNSGCLNIFLMLGCTKWEAKMCACVCIIGWLRLKPLYFYIYIAGEGKDACICYCNTGAKTRQLCFWSDLGRREVSGKRRHQ